MTKETEGEMARYWAARQEFEAALRGTLSGGSLTAFRLLRTFARFAFAMVALSRLRACV